jgi:hypothetical protein
VTNLLNLVIYTEILSRVAGRKKAALLRVPVLVRYVCLCYRFYYFTVREYRYRYTGTGASTRTGINLQRVPVLYSYPLGFKALQLVIAILSHDSRYFCIESCANKNWFRFSIRIYCTCKLTEYIFNCCCCVKRKNPK